MVNSMDADKQKDDIFDVYAHVICKFDTFEMALEEACFLAENGEPQHITLRDDGYYVSPVFLPVRGQLLETVR